MDIESNDALHVHLSLSSSCSTSMRSASSIATIYFGYGSNLWLHQMKQRCPTSKYLGVARLKGYRWIIYERGYANIVEASNDVDDDDDCPVPQWKHDYSNEVWGLVYSLQPDDEHRLDGNEGVPIAYRKEIIECELWSDNTDHAQQATDGKKPRKVDMLVYINRKLKEPSEPKKEYIYRMNMGIKDAVAKGVPKEYVRQVMRKFIPDCEDDAFASHARKQALQFTDER